MTSPVRLSETQEFEVAGSWLNKKGLLLAHEIESSGEPVMFKRGDVLLMLDSSWERYKEFENEFNRARRANVPIITCVYDLLPITLPKGNFVEGGSQWFENWLRLAICESDGLMCISQSVADDLKKYIENKQLNRTGLKIGWWHLGSDYSSKIDKKYHPSFEPIPKGPYYLMVGTIEPRKNHALALDAFEQLWKNDFDGKLVIAGKSGWMVEELVERIEKHDEYGKKLFHLSKLSDEDIEYLYQNATALLALSKGEGFGLPIIEAAHRDLAVICSDIAVFREVAGEFGTYTQIDKAENLSRTIQQWNKDYKRGQHVKTEGISPLTWQESAEMLIQRLRNQNWYFEYTDQ